jgi:hypothetical protein
MLAVNRKARATRSTEPMQASEPGFNAAKVDDLQQLNLVGAPDIAIVRRGRW